MIDRITISPTLLNEFRAGATRVNITCYRALGDDPFNPGILVTNNFQYEDVIYWSRGTHSMRFGGRVDRRQYNAFQSSAIRGVFNLSGVYTNNPADVVAGCRSKLYNPKPTRWFHTACFTIPAQFTFGNAGRNTIEGPGTSNFDFSLFKNIRFAQGDQTRMLQLRGEFFNVTNTPQFNQPNVTIGTPNAATINSAGSPTSFQRTQRQIQIAAKFIF